MTGITGQFDNLERMLDAAALRQRVIGQNIANVNTPGYHRHDVEFEESMRAELLGEGGAAPAQPAIVEDNLTPSRADGNNVDIDQEIGELSRNAMLYETWLQLIAGRLSSMHHAIRG